MDGPDVEPSAAIMASGINYLTGLEQETVL
jgi:hypothetical protein